jgi:hypothetical protein
MELSLHSFHVSYMCYIQIVVLKNRASSRPRDRECRQAGVLPSLACSTRGRGSVVVVWSAMAISHEDRNAVLYEGVVTALGNANG